MTHYRQFKHDFIERVVNLIEENLDNEEFGVSDLSNRLGMSRSNLLRKVKKLTGLSASLLIRQVRLHNAQELLRKGTLNVSQVSYRVGFNSSSYFIKCYKNEYGYSPGEEGKINFYEEERDIDKNQYSTRNTYLALIRRFAIVAGLIFILILWNRKSETPKNTEKSIAVLPFINDSNDSSNVYIINGVMESILNNLQKIEKLRVVSRSSVEKYRDRSLNIAEMAEELNVSYIIEGSGQKIGDQILLSVQLIEADNDNHLWSEQYNRSLTNIFQLQTEVAKDILVEIEVFLTEEEKKLISKVPTENVDAYDYYLKGLDLISNRSFDGLKDAIKYFRMAIEEDPNFAHAYAYVASCYFYLDVWQTPKKYGDTINIYSDRALFLDSELDHSLIAKGLFYLQDFQYQRAAEYFEKAFKINPNSTRAINFLSVIYDRYLSNHEKYVELTLRGAKINQEHIDSASLSTMHLHISNALIETGFVYEAEQHILLSRGYDPTNLFAEYVHAYIILAKNKDFHQTRGLLINALNKDTTRLDIIQELAKISYAMGDYDSAHYYYEKVLKLSKKYFQKIFQSENVKIAFVFDHVGKDEEAAKYLRSFKEYAESEDSIYKDFYLAHYYAITNDIDKGIIHLKKFSQQRKIGYWFVLMLSEDPIIQLMSQHSDFDTIVHNIEYQFWEDHQELRQRLVEEELI